MKNRPKVGKFQRAMELFQAGLLGQAQLLCEQILEIQPKHFDALHLSGVIATATNNPLRGIVLIGKAINISPNNAEFHFNLGFAHQAMKQLDVALDCYNKAISIMPNNVRAYYNRGIALQELRQLTSAVASYDKAIAINPEYALAYTNRGVALKELKQLDAALASYDKAIALKPDYAITHFNRGIVLQELKQLNAALASYDNAIALRADYARAYFNRGSVLQELKQLDAALASYDKAISLKPDYAMAYVNRGATLQELKQLDAALASYDKALAMKPEYAFLYGARLHTKMFLCDWANIDNEFIELTTRIKRNENASHPFPVLTITDNTSIQRQAAEISVREKHPFNHSLGSIAKRSRADKIRIGYYSADYHNHATTHLMAELFEQHNKNEFELIAFSFGPDASDGMRKRVFAAFDHFMDVRNLSDMHVALLSRNMGVDIAVDLKGLTQYSRPGIFSYRAAPIQVNYIGYPGTMGAEYIDYVIADKTLIPEASQYHYSEKVVYLPNSYQVNDSKRLISEEQFTRTELGLPETGFVFCCFNNNYKITPQIFGGWMRILQQVKGSVLWLLEDNPTAALNLGKEAEARGVRKDRLIFAKRMPLAEHLSRHRSADLFLDTLPCNAHTTASDALWAGLPVLTCMGEAFASRVAASLLNAIDLPELITRNQTAYEALAIELASHPIKLQAIKTKLEENRLATPLFDNKLYTKHIEDAYTQMYERYHSDLLPEHIYIN